MSKPKVYLAGPISGLSYAGSVDWRQQAIDELSPDIIGLSPMRRKQYLASETTIGDSHENHVLSCSRGITTRDQFDCTRSDAVLVNLLGSQRVSIGTVMEIAWADANRIPVILVMEETGNIHDHAMIRECIGFRVSTLEQGIGVAKALLSSFSQ